ncbi:NAD-dependent protein deacetylase 1 [Roseibium aquae]|uniref:protein acetyllysine N-acetyltransferase n=1 Tax=Roseibium aquae TaxID=1323746 RepID=A0A916TGC9_9HYPH|nr:Sir2 family NAD-dependent protein deacetylase [Roseibium aquae]GGB44363.1 NAD-dependent protein deacetylase 1 [Roseibium aquae]
MPRQITASGEAQTFLKAFFEAGVGERTLVLTGAGISTESGIPDFRSPGGIWSTRQPVQYQDFLTREDARLEDWQRRFEMLDFFERATPNAAHLALARLAREGLIDLLITQNVDGLHERAGTPEARLIEIHGNSTYATCLSCGKPAPIAPLRAHYETGRSPCCEACGGLLKAAVISFGQSMPEAELSRAASASLRCDRFIVIGSSLLVHPAAALPAMAADAGAELVIVNREETPLDPLANMLIRSPIAESFAGVPV